jgi:hypothetical protein
MQDLIQKKIYEVRGHKVMLDFDLAELYKVPTKTLNQAVKRNLDRFPVDFMFQLTNLEWKDIFSSINLVDNQSIEGNWSQIVTSSLKNRGKLYRPYAFTEHGITMLASLLKSKTAVRMNIEIVRAFIALRQFALNYRDLAEQVRELREKTGEHDLQLKDIYDAIEGMLNAGSQNK